MDYHGILWESMGNKLKKLKISFKLLNKLTIIL